MVPLLREVSILSNLEDLARVGDSRLLIHNLGMFRLIEPVICQVLVDGLTHFGYFGSSLHCLETTEMSSLGRKLGNPGGLGRLRSVIQSILTV